MSVIRKTTKSEPPSYEHRVEHLELYFCVQKNDRDTAKSLLEQASEDDIKVLETRLTIAALENGSSEMLSLLIENKVNISAKDANGSSPLHMSVQDGDLRKVSILLEKGAKTDVKNASDHTPLVLAILEDNLEIFDKILESEPNVNFKCVDSKTALHFAAECSQTAMVERLLRRNARTDSSTNGWQIALHFAAANGSLDIVKLLLNDNDINSVDRNFVTPLHVAAREGHAKVVEALLLAQAAVSPRTIFQETPLHLAASGGHAETVDLLLAANASVNVTTNYDDTPLLCALKNKHFGIAKALLEHNAAIDQEDGTGRTPLIRAIEDKDEEMIEFLLENGASVNCARRNIPPLYYAIKSHSPFVGALIEKGANVNYVGESTMLHCAIEFGNYEALVLLLQNKADVKVETNLYSPLQFSLELGFNRLTELLIKHCYQLHKKKESIGNNNLSALKQFMSMLQELINAERKRLNVKTADNEAYVNLKEVQEKIKLHLATEFNGCVVHSTGRIILQDKIMSSQFVEFILEFILGYPKDKIANINKCMEMVLNISY